MIVPLKTCATTENLCKIYLKAIRTTFFFFFLFTPCKAKQQLQGMELPEKEAQKYL